MSSSSRNLWPQVMAGVTGAVVGLAFLTGVGVAASSNATPHHVSNNPFVQAAGVKPARHEAASETEAEAPAVPAPAAPISDYDTLLAKGQPAQLYASALQYDAQGKSDQVTQIYQTLIARFPESPYTAKAIEKMEAASQAAKAQQQQAVQQAAAQEAAAQKEAQQQQLAAQFQQQQQAQKIAFQQRCTESCELSHKQCVAQANAESSKATLAGYLNAFSRNSSTSSMLQTYSDMTSAQTQKNSCETGLQQCNLQCG